MITIFWSRSKILLNEIKNTEISMLLEERIIIIFNKFIMFVLFCLLNAGRVYLENPRYNTLFYETYSVTVAVQYASLKIYFEDTTKFL